MAWDRIRRCHQSVSTLILIFCIVFPNSFIFCFCCFYCFFLCSLFLEKLILMHFVLVNVGKPLFYVFLLFCCIIIIVNVFVCGEQRRKVEFDYILLSTSIHAFFYCIGLMHIFEIFEENFEVFPINKLN